LKSLHYDAQSEKHQIMSIPIFQLTWYHITVAEHSLFS